MRRQKQRLTDAVVQALPVPETGLCDPPRCRRARVRAANYSRGREIVHFGLLHTGIARPIGHHRAISGLVGREGPPEGSRAKTGNRRRHRPAGRARGAARGTDRPSDLLDRFEAEHLPRKREKTAKEYRSILRVWVRPHFGSYTKVADVTFSDIDRLHHKITASGAKFRANRAVAVLSKMFALAVKWGMRPDNPAKGIERNTEHHRTAIPFRQTNWLGWWPRSTGTRTNGRGYRSPAFAYRRSQGRSYRHALGCPRLKGRRLAQGTF